MRKLGFVLAALLFLGIAGPAMGAQFEFHGDMNHRFMLYSNHVDFFVLDQDGVLHDGSVDDNFGEIKYRFWFEAASDDGAVKGVFATEIGGLRFGESDSAPYSGDKIKMEVRWGYLDFQLPGVDSKARFRLGLQPFNVNEYLWKETAAGINFNGAAGVLDYQLAWMRGYEVDLKSADEDDDRRDVDAFLARLNCKPAEGADAGLFLLYQTSDADAQNVAGYGSINSIDYQIKKWEDKVDLDLWTLGTDGKYDLNPFFVNWDLMFQTGSVGNAAFLDSASQWGRVDDDFDVSAWFLHLDLGMKMGDHKLTYTFWYASGDDDPTDDNFDAFISTDLDRADSICLMEGGYTDDDYFTEKPYILDKGFVMNKLALDSKVTDKLTVGAALMYMMTAEDIEYMDNTGQWRKEDKLGIELDAYMKYMLYKNVEFALNAGYLWADDALDFFEVDEIKDGNSDENIFATTARVRYKF